MRALSSLAISVMVMAAMGLTACVKRQDAPAPAAPIVASEPGVFHPDRWPSAQAIAPATLSQDRQARIESLMARMSLRQKIGAIIAVDEAYISPKDLADYPIGFIISDRYDPQSLGRAQDYYEQALAADLEGGPFVPPLRLLSRPPAALPISIGAAARGQQDDQARFNFAFKTRSIASNQSFAARRAGFDGLIWSYMGAEIESGEQSGLGLPSGFDGDPERAARSLAALINQDTGKTRSGDYSRDLVGVGPVLGTYVLPEQNALRDDSARVHITIDEAALIAAHGPRLSAIVQQVPDLMMLTPQIWQGTPITGSQLFMQDILRARLAYDGVIMGARDGHGQMTGCTVSKCPSALRAGLDLYYAGAQWRELFDNLFDDVVKRRLDETQIDRALVRILNMKLKSGVFTAGAPNLRSGQSAERERVEHEIGAPLARELARYSAVLVKNRRRVLPLSPLDHIAILRADEASPLSVQIEDSFKAAIDQSGGMLSVNDLPESLRADIALIILDQSVDTPETIAAIKDSAQILHRRDMPVVFILASQNLPRLDDDGAAIFDMAQGVVLAWHPEQGAPGLTDLVFASQSGQIIYDFAAKLPFDWRIGTSPFFEAGYGLTYFVQ